MLGIDPVVNEKMQPFERTNGAKNNDLISLSQLELQGNRALLAARACPVRQRARGYISRETWKAVYSDLAFRSRLVSLAKETSVGVLAVSVVGPIGNPANQTMREIAASVFLLRHTMPQIMP